MINKFPKKHQKKFEKTKFSDATTSNALALATGDGNGEQQQLRRSDSKSKKFGRSKSSDILKKESVALPYDKGKMSGLAANTTLTRLNSLKQWGKNRFKFMQRNAGEHNATLSTINSSGASNELNTSGSSTHNSSTEKAEICSASGSASGSSAKTSSTAKCGEKCATDLDDECGVQELIAQRKSECRFSHERKPSYSSSEKSMSVSSSGHLRGKLHLNSVVSANVKLRDTSSLNRQRRINGLTGKDDQPHSSSGNWSASSESGRASIGSEITLQPKSSASNTSLNASSTFHNGSSAPPSSMLSRRRFLNTSASSSVTGSEGTCTPDLQMASEHGYPGHLDDETSSAYSCDTEGYYTSFHMDSGLRTLKEEEINMNNFQIGAMTGGAAMLNNGTLNNGNNSQLSFGSNSQQTLMATAENEYELFGKGSTSTTTSSAGTVCTTLMAHNGAEQSSLNNSLISCGPEVPERISSLRNSSASCSTLERSISSSTIGSTLERTGTIKRNVNASLKLSIEDNLEGSITCLTTPESQEDEFKYSTENIKNRAALPLPASHAADVEYSESSDLEGVERIERIKQKTAINARRIPSMCIITPSTSDDENDRQANGANNDDGDDDDDVLNKTLTEESFEALLENEKPEALDSKKASKSDIKLYEQTLNNNLNHLKSHCNASAATTDEKLKVVLPMVKTMPAEHSVINDDKLYDMAGEYVYISADVRNNNSNKKSLAAQQPQQQQQHYNTPKVAVSSSLGIYYSNNIMRQTPQATEYVSLNDLPKTLKKSHNNVMESLVGMQKQNGGCLSETEQRQYVGQSADSAQQFRLQQQQQHEQQQRPNAIANEKESANTAMYAEINELRSEIAASAPYTPPSSNSSSPHVSPHKGARVRLNAQGKPIYDSDSLKRRKGAHTTFAPGPYVKTQQEQIENESFYKSLTQNSNSITTASESVNPAVKLLLLNKSQINPRKIANVRPIINTSSNNARQLLTSRPLPSTPLETAKDMSSAGSTATMLQPYFHTQSAGGVHHQHHSAMAANNAMHSPLAKSTGSSSAGSTISASTTNSSSTTHSSGGTASISSSINSKDEGKTPIIHHISLGLDTAEATASASSTSPSMQSESTPICLASQLCQHNVNNYKKTNTKKIPETDEIKSSIGIIAAKVNYNGTKSSKDVAAEAQMCSLQSFQAAKVSNKENESSLNQVNKVAAMAAADERKSHLLLLPTTTSPIMQHKTITISPIPSPTPPPPPPPLPPRGCKPTKQAHTAAAKYPPNHTTTNGIGNGNAFPFENTKNDDKEFIHCDIDEQQLQKQKEPNIEKSISSNDDPKTNLTKTTTTTNATTHFTTDYTFAPTPPPPPPTFSTSTSSDVIPNATSSPLPNSKHMPLKRNNSYRLANDDLKLEMNKENHLIFVDNQSIRTPSPQRFFKSLPRQQKIKNVLQNVLLDDSAQQTSLPQSAQSDPSSRKIAKSFERLVDEFSLSTISVDSSYLRNKSLENFDDSPSILTNLTLTDSSNQTITGEGDTSTPNNTNADENDSDSDIESLVTPQTGIPQIKYHKSFIDSVLLKPLKIMLPNEDNRRQKMLHKFEATEIW